MGATGGRRLADTVSAVAIVVSVAVIVSIFMSHYGRAFDAASAVTRAPSAPIGPIPIAQLHRQGSDVAPLVMVVASDFECPFCRRFALEVLPAIRERYVSTGVLTLAFEHFPLSFHPFALPAAELSECAGDEGLFWQMHDVLFERQEDLSTRPMLDFGELAGVTGSRFRECVGQHTTRNRITEQAMAAERQGVSGTPTLFIGERDSQGRAKIVNVTLGVVSVSRLDDIIEVLLEGRKGHD